MLAQKNNYKFQLFILTFSVCLHLSFFYLLSFYSNSISQSKSQNIEVIYKNQTKNKRIIKENLTTDLDRKIKNLQKTTNLLSKTKKRYLKQEIQKIQISKNIRKQRTQTKIKEQLIKPSNKSLEKSLYSAGPANQASFLQNIPHIKFGSLNLLNTDQLTYYAFFNRLNQNFGNHWAQYISRFNSRLGFKQRRFLSKRKHITRIEIILDPNGELLEVFLHHPSGIKALDNAALKAINKIAPIQNPPGDLVEDDGLIHLHYALEVSWKLNDLAKSPKY